MKVACASLLAIVVAAWPVSGSSMDPQTQGQPTQGQQTQGQQTQGQQTQSQQPQGQQTQGQQTQGQPAQEQQTSSSDAAVLSFAGDTALWTVAIKPDKTADFEQILSKLRQALASSENPQRRQQAAGWRVMRMSDPLPNGSVAYVHIINPVVPGADYAVMPILYDAYPDERQQLYELYRGAFAGNVAVAVGDVVATFGEPPPTPQP